MAPAMFTPPPDSATTHQIADTTSASTIAPPARANRSRRGYNQAATPAALAAPAI